MYGDHQQVSVPNRVCPSLETLLRSAWPLQRAHNI